MPWPCSSRWGRRLSSKGSLTCSACRPFAGRTSWAHDGNTVRCPRHTGKRRKPPVPSWWRPLPRPTTRCSKTISKAGRPTPSSWFRHCAGRRWAIACSRSTVAPRCATRACSRYWMPWWITSPHRWTCLRWRGRSQNRVRPSHVRPARTSRSPPWYSSW